MVFTVDKKEIEYIAVSDLIPYINNSRTHSEQQVSQIAASIKEFGFTNPLLIDGDRGIIAGHGRLLAAQKLGMDDVPCIALDHLSEAQRKALVIADNKLALNAGWDLDLLRCEIGELDALGFDIGALGFDEGELDALNPTPIDEYPDLPDGEKSPFQQMTFTLHDEQADSVSNALRIAKEMGEFVDSPNENGNGNALSRVCEMFVGQYGVG